MPELQLILRSTILSRTCGLVANARKNTIISEEGFKNIAALSDIASNSGGSALDVLDSALENVEEVQQFAVLVEAGGVDVTNFDPDSFDFEVAFESGALKTLRSDLFSGRGYTFNEYFDSEDSTPLSLDSDNFAVITAVDSFISSNNIQAVLDPIDPSGDTKILHNDGSFVYELSASQVNTLTGLTDGVAGQYKFEELLDADTGAVTGVTITPATKKLGIDEVLTFSIDAERAGDVLFVLDSPVLKPTEGDSDEILATKANYIDLFINNVDQIDNLTEIGKVLGEDDEKIDVVFNNLSLLDDLTPLTKTLRDQPAKLQYVFDGISGETDGAYKAEVLSMFNSLVQTYINQPARLNAIFKESNFDYLFAINDLTPLIGTNNAQLDLLFDNIENSYDILSIANRFEGTKRDQVLAQIGELLVSPVMTDATQKTIFENPSQVASLYKLEAMFSDEFDKMKVIFTYADKADSFLDVLNELKGPDGSGSYEILFTNTLVTLEETGLAKLSADYPEYINVFTENSDIAAEISSTASKFKDDPEKLELVFTNIDKLDQINEFVNEFGGYETVVDQESGESVEKFVYDDVLVSIFFANINDLSGLIDFKGIGEVVGIPGFDALDIFDKEPAWLDFVLQDTELVRGEDGRIVLSDKQRKAGKFLADLYETSVPIEDVPMPLAVELLELGLTTDELATVITDLLDGPLLSAPDSDPPSFDDPGTSADLQTLSFLLNHDFSGTIDPNLIVSADVAMASSFFKETLEVYDALSLLGENLDDYTPASGSDVTDPDSSGSVTLGDNGTSSDSTSHSDVDFDGALGGSNLKFGAGQYDLSQLNYDRLLIAASDHLSISGTITFTADQTEGVFNQLILLSAGGVNIEKGTSLSYQGESFGIGSFNSLNVIGVDLFAQNELSLRSLDRLVLNDVHLQTNPNGQVALLAHQEISVDNLRFNEHVKRIAMEAMTINLKNLNFPNGSMVKLNSAYGPLDGRYPNFNSIMWGRVNFITNMRYANNSIMSRSEFDTHGGNISIGKIGN